MKSVSFLLHNEHGFDQAPMEEITHDQWLEMSKSVTRSGVDSASTWTTSTLQTVKAELVLYDERFDQC